MASTAFCTTTFFFLFVVSDNSLWRILRRLNLSKFFLHTRSKIYRAANCNPGWVTYKSSKQTMTLFNGLNIYLDSSTLGKDTNELKRLLEKEKANVLASPSKKTTHVVTNNHNYTQTDAVNAKLVSVRPEKLIVNSMQPKWIKDSIKANERAKYAHRYKN